MADDEGNIYSYRNLDYTNKSKQEVNYLKSELKDQALQVAVQMNPVLKGHLKLISCDYSGVYQNSIIERMK